MEGPGLEFSEAVIDNGKYGRHTIRFESGILAQQADGSAAVYLDVDTMLLAATTAAKTPRDAIDFFPLTVDIEERMYAAGRIPGSFFRREGRPGEGAILAARLIDRPLRPAFVKGLRNEVQVIVDPLLRRGRDQCRIHGHDLGRVALLRSHRRCSCRPDRRDLGVFPDRRTGRQVLFPDGRRWACPA